eukprot:2231349-Pleurochrysis_carterae.AAC.1
MGQWQTARVCNVEIVGFCVGQGSVDGCIADPVHGMPVDVCVHLFVHRSRVNCARSTIQVIPNCDFPTCCVRRCAAVLASSSCAWACICDRAGPLRLRLEGRGHVLALHEALSV